MAKVTNKLPDRVAGLEIQWKIVDFIDGLGFGHGIGFYFAVSADRNGRAHNPVAAIQGFRWKAGVPIVVLILDQKAASVLPISYAGLVSEVRTALESTLRDGPVSRMVSKCLFALPNA